MLSGTLIKYVKSGCIQTLSQELKRSSSCWTKCPTYLFEHIQIKVKNPSILWKPRIPWKIEQQRHLEIQKKNYRKKDLFQTNQSSNIRRDSFSNARDSKLGMKGNLNALKNGFWAGADSSILRPRITKVI